MNVPALNFSSTCALRAAELHNGARRARQVPACTACSRWQKGFAHACVQRLVRGAGLLLRERYLALEQGRGRVRVDIYYGLQGLRLLECSDAQPPRHRADKAAATPRHRNAASVRSKLATAQTTTCAMMRKGRTRRPCDLNAPALQARIDVHPICSKCRLDVTRYAEHSVTTPAACAGAPVTRQWVQCWSRTYSDKASTKR